MADKKLNIKVSTPGAKKSKAQLKGLSGSISSLGKAALATGVAYFGARGLISGLSSAIRLAGEQEQAEKKLEVALGKKSKALLANASALQKMTTFGDEAIIGVQASLAAFIKDEEQIKKATEATLDMAVAMGMDLKAAGDLVAKTLGSSTNAMSRYGIEVDGAVGSTERLESLTGNVAKLFGGQAKAQADTYAGSVQQMKNSLGDMGEQLGQILIPIFQELEPHLNLAIDFWGKYFGSLKDSKDEHIKLSPVVQDITKQIEAQASLVDYISGESYRTFVLIKKRAIDQSRTIAAQIKFETEEIARQIDILEELNTKKDKQLKLEKALTIQSGINLQLRRAEIDMDIEYVKVVEPTQKKVREQIQLAGALSTALQTTFDPDLGAGEAFKGFVIQLMSAMQGVILASKAVSEAMTFTFTGPVGVSAAIASLIALEIAKAGVRSIKFAETGFDGVVNRPTMFMTGEAGAERVQVTPLQGPNINGPQGGITLNISAPLVDETVIDSIIPAIQKAQRMNLA